MNRVVDNYQNRIPLLKQKLRKSENRLRFISFGRLLFFTGIIVAIWHFDSIGIYWSTAIVFSLLTFFIFSVRYYNLVQTKKQLIKNLIKINQNEILAVCREYLHFEDGNEFEDTLHHYTLDLDIFNRGGFFQYINRTYSTLGKQKLASILSKPLIDSSQIIFRQKAIEELSNLLDWRQKFTAIGLLKDASNDNRKIIENWNQLNIPIFLNSKLLIIFRIFSLLTIASIALNGLTLIPWSIPSTLAIIQLVTFWFFKKHITNTQNELDNIREFLQKNIQLIRHIKQQTFSSELLKSYKKELFDDSQVISRIKQLEHYLSALDTGSSMMGILLLNSTLFWNISYFIKLTKWREANRQSFPKWIDTISKIEALNSIANFAYNNPQFIYPAPISEDRITIKEMGHPLIESDTCITNDFAIDLKSEIHLVTGANMAGKSTFLRTVGINLVLAMCGAPVFAKEMEFTPINLFTHMRTNDSLLNDESYFYAELKRLKQMLDIIEKGERIFVVLDEILRGTNSIDKLNGSRQFILRLMENRTSAVIATHDLKLSEMENEYSKVKNFSFDVILDENELQYPYKISQGATTTMNATFLMKKMGIIK